MRLWSVHPRYLDRQGLTACWREGLLAQKVLTGTTRGYRNHPQLGRFRAVPGAGAGEQDLSGSPPPGASAAPGARASGATSVPEGSGSPVHPGAAVTTYLHGVVDVAAARGYSFDRSKILAAPDPTVRLEVTTGQLAYEWAHLRLKLAARSPDVLARWADVELPEPHPMFVVVPGPVAPWEVMG